jgi:predicted lipoprotein with Yx(FWY)xxD motif
MNKKTVIALVIVLLFVGGIFFYLSKVPKTKLDPNAIVTSRTSSNLGTYLTDTKGMTLYTFKDDKPLASVCVDQCKKEWPPFEYNNRALSLSTDVLSKRLNIIPRTDSPYAADYYQYTYALQPLYYYAGDMKAGDVNGNGLEGKWDIVPVE